VEERATQIINKFIYALGLMLLNYLLIDCICHFTDPSQKISPLMIIPGYLIISKAELLLSPIGTSAMTILSCRKKVSTMMGIFFVSLGLGGFFSGKLASLTAVSQQDMSIELLKQHYTLGFSKLSGILLIAFILSLILKVFSTRILNHQAHDSKAS
jgi:POT family proton-dependent oligopeptide transporter